MLTAQEQWKILREEEERTGRGRTKKKTLTEQLKDMGAFGGDPDSEQAIIEELERSDTRAPLQDSQASISECEVFFGQSSFLESRKRLFHSWLFQARRPNSWMEEKDLPLVFRFALRRPIMDERSFRAVMQDMNVQLETSTGDVRQPYTQPSGRSRQLMFGYDLDGKTNHVSSRFKTVLPKGTPENMDRAKDEATKMFQEQEDDEDMQELVRRQLWAVHEHVQNGSVALESATWHYRDAFNNQDMSDETLVICLELYGLPTDHIPTNERNARRNSAKYPISGSVNDVKPLFDDETVSKITTELANYIKLFRDGVLHELEAISMIKDSLEGLYIESNDISDILDDLEKDVETAAKLMWLDAVENEPSSSSSSEKEESHQYQENSLRAVVVPDPHANGEESHDAARASTVNGIRSHDGLMGPPVNRPGKLPTYSHVDKEESKLLPPGTPTPKPVCLAHALENSDSQKDIESNRESPRDRATASRRPPSPDEGMTTGIWGLLMPIKEARRFAYILKLPQDTIDEQVRSISPRRIRKRKASHAKTVVTFPKSKRKASIVLHKDAPPKSPKYGDHSDFFAREGEDQETFVLSHFDHEHIRSKHKCMRCLSLPCECEYRSSPPLMIQPECFKCLQQPCICRPLPTPTVPPKRSPSSDPFEANLTDRTRSESRKQSITLLTYLSRVLNDDDVLTSLKQSERLPPEDTTVAYVKTILDNIQQVVSAGEHLDATGDDDQEAIRILGAIIPSSHALSEYSEKIHREIERASTPTTEVDDCRDRAKETLDLESSLLNSSKSDVPDLPPNPVANAATFPEAQSHVAHTRNNQAIKIPLGKGFSPYLPTVALDSSILQPESCSESKVVVQPSRFQSVRPSESSAVGDPPRAENSSDSPECGKISRAGAYTSKAECASESPTGSPLSSTAGLSEQVSDHPVDAESDADNKFGASLKRQPFSTSQNTSNSNVETRPPPSPRPAAREIHQIASSASLGATEKSSPDSIPLPLPGTLWRSPKSIPPGTPRLGSRELPKETLAARQIDSFSPGFDSLPVWPPQPDLQGGAGKEWKNTTFKKALKYAKEMAFDQRKSFSFYLEERRAIRSRIKKAKQLANSDLSNHRFFQSSNGLSGSSGTATIAALNKLFDKYRDNAVEEPDKIGIEGSMRYLADLGVKLDEVVVLAILTELSAPTMGEFTREGFVNGWQNHRAETLPKQQGQIASFRRSLSSTPDFFKRVYKQTFLIARLPGQKIVPLETALEYWRLLFTAPSLSWGTANTPWLTYWFDYLEKQWKKSVSKDMWDQTGVFAMKSLDDESMSWWSEDGAWPGVLDEFVFYVKEKRGKTIGGGESEMDVG